MPKQYTNVIRFDPSSSNNQHLVTTFSSSVIFVHHRRGIDSKFHHHQTWSAAIKQTSSRHKQHLHLSSSSVWEPQTRGRAAKGEDSSSRAAPALAFQTAFRFSASSSICIGMRGTDRVHKICRRHVVPMAWRSREAVARPSGWSPSARRLVACVFFGAGLTVADTSFTAFCNSIIVALCSWMISPLGHALRICPPSKTAGNRIESVRGHANTVLRWQTRVRRPRGPVVGPP